MIEREELKKIINDINMTIDEQYGTEMPNIELYSEAMDGVYGSDFICSLSFQRKAIVINYDELCRMYPYMDNDSIKAMLSNSADRTMKKLLY